MCAWIYFVELKYSQLKINHLNNTPSTKAVGGRIYSGVFDKDVKVPVKVMRQSWLAPLLPTPTNYPTIAQLVHGCTMKPSLDHQYMVDDPSLKKCHCHLDHIRSAKQDDDYGASNIILPCSGSYVIFHLVKDVVIIFKSSI